MIEMMASHAPLVWGALVLAAVLIGLDKSLIPGAAIIGTGLLATLIPAQQASGFTLAIIIAADWTAIWAYRRNVEWRALARLLPNVGIGVLCGAAFLFVADNTVTKRLIGIIILVFIALNLWMMWRRRRARPTETVAEPASEPEPASGERRPGGRLKALLYGGVAGFTTMVANAGGPASSLYFLSEGFSVARFLGTTAWFYLIINLVKAPFAVGLRMITWQTVLTVAFLVPIVVATVFLGRWLSKRVRRDVFSVLVIVLSALAGVLLLL